MKVQVELLAFSKGEIREVEISGEAVDLDEVFHNGQNHIQPLEMPSVSVGDVILDGDKKFMVIGAGFKELTNEEYELYKSLDDRSIEKFMMQRS